MAGCSRLFAVSSTFFAAGQIYVKILPDGEPVQLTHDNLTKMSPAFSPDGARIAYTTVDPQFNWDTWVVPALGGEPQLLAAKRLRTGLDRSAAGAVFGDQEGRPHGNRGGRGEPDR